MPKKLSQSAVLSVDGSDIFSDNYKDSTDIHNIPTHRSFMLHKINLNYKTAVKSNTF